MRFGTDGIRGIYNIALDDRLAYEAGRAAGYAMRGSSVLLGRDTRESGSNLEEAICRGLIAGGKNVILAGVIPTPAVAYLTTKLKAGAGIMITASHNPPEYNGIKIFGPGGLKISEAEEKTIDYYIDNRPPMGNGGKITCLPADELYIEHISKIAGKLGGLKIIEDCGNGAAHTAAHKIFEKAGAQIKSINDSGDGSRINQGCGALYPEAAAEYTAAGYDIGFSYDGDADRVSVSAGGKVLDGDSVLYNLCRMTGAQTVVGTVLTNSALEEQLREEDKKLIRTAVGDKYIARIMQEENHKLGGEQSGHFIVRPYSQTGDAILTAVLLAKYIAGGESLERLTLVPQKAISEFATESTLGSAAFAALKSKAERMLGSKGRLITRMSGTEPKLRVMVESADAGLVDEILSEFKKLLG